MPEGTGVSVAAGSAWQGVRVAERLSTYCLKRQAGSKSLGSARRCGVAEGRSAYILRGQMPGVSEGLGVVVEGLAYILQHRAYRVSAGSA